MIIDNTIQKHAPMRAPMPGQGWTSDPERPMKWETPPDIVDVEEAVLEVVHPLITNEDALKEFIRLAEGGVPLEFMVTLGTYEGFKAGKWNPDVMLLMQEPLMYWMIAICEQADIEYNLDEDDMQRTLEDPSYRYSSDPEMEGEISAIVEEKVPDAVDEDLLSQVRGKKGLMSPPSIEEEVIEDEEELM